MTFLKYLRPTLTMVCCGAVALATACHREEPFLDRPKLTPNVALRDMTFHSVALRRDMQYRVIMPAGVPPGSNLPVVYLLHGGNGDYRDWTNYSDVARFAEHGLILVMPQGDESYYTNSAERPQDRYEDYVIRDLIRDVETRFPAARPRAPGDPRVIDGRLRCREVVSSLSRTVFFCGRPEFGN
ncbi:MAG TPA: alpha/beta hydrolase-fold protein [Terriglobales bacterium]|nr:alpha/beta hydrolase-fold protein [Terriglobales bacterium]